MKHLQKPIFPLFILILILSAFEYREFVKDYTKTEKEIKRYQVIAKDKKGANNYSPFDYKEID